MDDIIRQAVEQGFAKQGFMQTLGAKLTDVGAGTCEVSLDHHIGLTQQHGLFHGGVVATLADNAAGFAAYSLMQNGRQPLTIEFKINLLAPAMGKRLIARGEVLRAGHSISHVRSDVFSEETNGCSLVATALVTIKSTKAVTEISETRASG